MWFKPRKKYIKFKGFKESRSWVPEPEEDFWGCGTSPSPFLERSPPFSSSELRGSRLLLLKPPSCLPIVFFPLKRCVSGFYRQKDTRWTTGFSERSRRPSGTGYSGCLNDLSTGVTATCRLMDLEGPPLVFCPIYQITNSNIFQFFFSLVHFAFRNGNVFTLLLLGSNLPNSLPRIGENKGFNSSWSALAQRTMDSEGCHLNSN